MVKRIYKIVSSQKQNKPTMINNYRFAGEERYKNKQRFMNISQKFLQTRKPKFVLFFLSDKDNLEPMQEEI
jgi:hypothetical protein